MCTISVKTQHYFFLKSICAFSTRYSVNSIINKYYVHIHTEFRIAKMRSKDNALPLLHARLESWTKNPINNNFDINNIRNKPVSFIGWMLLFFMRNRKKHENSFQILQTKSVALDVTQSVQAMCQFCVFLFFLQLSFQEKKFAISLPALLFYNSFLDLKQFQ